MSKFFTTVFTFYEILLSRLTEGFMSDLGLGVWDFVCLGNKSRQPFGHRHPKMYKTLALQGQNALPPAAPPSYPYYKPIIEIDLYIYAYSYTYTHIYIYYILNTSSTAQGGGGSFKNRKPIGEVGCCESGMAERSHSWIERWLISLTILSFSDYLPTYLSIYLSTYLSIDLSISLSPSSV